MYRVYRKRDRVLDIIKTLALVGAWVVSVGYLVSYTLMAEKGSGSPVCSSLVETPTETKKVDRRALSKNLQIVWDQCTGTPCHEKVVERFREKSRTALPSAWLALLERDVNQCVLACSRETLSN